MTPKISLSRISSRKGEEERRRRERGFALVSAALFLSTMKLFLSLKAEKKNFATQNFSFLEEAWPKRPPLFFFLSFFQQCPPEGRASASRAPSGAGERPSLRPCAGPRRARSPQRRRRQGENDRERERKGDAMAKGAASPSPFSP